MSKARLIRFEGNFLVSAVVFIAYGVGRVLYVGLSRIIGEDSFVRGRFFCEVFTGGVCGEGGRL